MRLANIKIKKKDSQVRGSFVNVKRLTSEREIVVSALVSVVSHIEKI